jgi:hypothetical protein
MLLPAVAVAASRLGRRHVIAAAAVALALTWSGIHNLHAFELTVQSLTPVREHTEARILAASHLVGGTVTAVGVQPESSTSPDLTWSDLEYLVQSGDLPSQGPIPPDALDLVTVAANVQMAWSPIPLLPNGATSIQPAGSVALVPAAPGCVTATGAGSPTVELVFARAASVLIRAPVGSAVSARLRMSPSSPAESPPHPLVVDGSGTVSLNVSLAGAAAIVDLPPAGAVLCAVGP